MQTGGWRGEGGGWVYVHDYRTWVVAMNEFWLGAALPKQWSALAWIERSKLQKGTSKLGYNMFTKRHVSRMSIEASFIITQN